MLEVQRLADKTGVPFSGDSLGEERNRGSNFNEKFDAEEERIADITKHGVRRGPTSDEALVSATGYYDTPAIETEDAIVAGHHDDGLFAQTKERTGKYTTGGIYSRLATGDVTVERPDGNGGTYVGKLKARQSLKDTRPKPAERAAAIISKRAAERVKKATVDRAISVADELQKERDKG